MRKNKSLLKARKIKDDEYYTEMSEVRKELDKQEIQDFIKGKIVYCNCSGESSKFVVYFKELLSKGIIKDLIYTSTDFRSQENIENLKRCDVVIENPPFSLFREYITTLLKYDKKFLVIGNINTITTKEVFPNLLNGKLWFDEYDFRMDFDRPDGSKKAVNVSWFTNIPIKRNIQQKILTEKYEPDLYPKYDNYDAIEVGKVKDIPIDYYDYIGVPISVLKYYNPDTGCLEFEV